VSTYMIDGGLWLACYDSKKAIGTQLCRENDKSEEPVIGRLAGEGLNADLMAVFPGQDLLILQPHSLDELSWGSLNYKVLFGLQGRGPCTISGMKNIAIPYDPAWVKPSATGDASSTRPEERMLAYFINACLRSSIVDNIWLVDYKFRRRHIAPTRLQSKLTEGQVFYQRDRRLVEVRRVDHHEWWDPNEFVQGEPGHDIRNIDFDCHAFVDAVREGIAEEDAKHVGSAPPQHASFGLLACEYF
jgi:hypothetical protein